MGVFNCHKENAIAKKETASDVKVWILNVMVGITISVVGFFGSRLVNQVDEMGKSLQAALEVQASQSEIIKGLQRDNDDKGKEIEKLNSDVEGLKESNAVLRAKSGIKVSYNVKPCSAGFFYE